MKRKLIDSVLLMAAVLLAAPAFGQITRDAELNLFFGGSGYNKKEFRISAPQEIPPVEAEQELAEALRGGVRFNVANNGRWGQEFFYSYEGNRVRFTRFSLPTPVVDLPIQVHNFGITGLFYFTEDEQAKHRPFASFGLGATVYRPHKGARSIADDPNIGNLPGFGQSNEFSFHYGLGLKERLNDVFGLRLDVRHFLGRNPSFSMSRRSDDPNEQVFPATGAIHNLEVTGGIIFYFGR